MGEHIHSSDSFSLSSFPLHCVLGVTANSSSVFITLIYRSENTTMGTSPNRRGRHSPTRSKAAGSASRDSQLAMHLSSEKKNSLRRRIRNVLIGIFVSGVLVACLRGYFFDHALGHMQYSPQAQFTDWDDRREEVRDVFLTSWTAYKKHAWGKMPLVSSRPLPKCN